MRLELDAYLCQQAVREALDTKEVTEARERHSHITQLSKVRCLVDKSTHGWYFYQFLIDFHC